MKPNEHYIGDWVVHPEAFDYVDIETASFTYAVVSERPNEFDFSIQELINVAKNIFGVNEYIMGIESLLYRTNEM